MILQGMVLLLVLIHPLVSQTGDLVCIRAFFRVEGKAAAGADRQKTACNMIGCCNSLTDKLDLAVGLCRGHCPNGQQGKFIAAHGVYFFQRPMRKPRGPSFTGTSPPRLLHRRKISKKSIPCITQKDTGSFPLFAENSRWLCSILDFRSAPRPHR